MEEFNLDNFVNATYSMGMRQDAASGWVSSSDADEMMDMLIVDSCGGKSCQSAEILRKGEMPYSVEYLADNLPAVYYVTQFYVEMIIHGGIIADNESSQQKLDKWLASRNILGETNGNVIREALLASVTYGYAGLRRIGNGLVFVSPNHFKIWKLPAFMDGQAVPGIWKPYFYECCKKVVRPVEDNKAKSEEQTESQFIKSQDLHKGVDGSYFIGVDAMNAENIFVPEELFCHLRHSDSGDYGISPLSKDRLRTTLIIDYLRNVDDEINNDGTDYMMYLQRRSSIGGSLAGIISAASANATINAAMDAKEHKNAEDNQMNAARALAKKMKRSAKTRMNLINQNVVDRVEKMPGTVELNQYLSILNDAKGVIADIYGIAAMLAGSSGGGWSTGMSALIDFTLERTIKPFQQRYAEQLSPMIKSCAGIVPDIHFKEIDWTDLKTQAEIDKLRAETQKALAEANKAKVEEAKTKQETKDLKSGKTEGGVASNKNTIK